MKRMKLLKQCLAGLLAAAMLVPNTLVFAETNDVTTSGQSESLVTKTIESEFSVLVPKVIDFGNDTEKTFDVSAKGNIERGSSIEVTSDRSVSMMRTNDSAYIGSANMDLEAVWLDNELKNDYTSKDGNVVFDEYKAGEYAGVTNFYINHLKEQDYLDYTLIRRDLDELGIPLSGDIVIPRSFVRDGKRYKITEIGNSVFSECPTIRSVVLPNTIKSIGSRAFYRCRGLQSINIPNSVTSIGEYAFESCESLQSIVIPNNVVRIGFGTFTGCSSLKNVEIKTNVLVTHMFNACESLESITIPEGVTRLPESVFPNCTSLKRVSLPDSLVSIGANAFYNCSQLQDVQLPKNIREIGVEAFRGCTSLSSLEIPEGFVRLTELSLCGITNLKSVTLPKSLERMDNRIFLWNDNLEEIRYRGTLEQWNAISKDSRWDMESSASYCKKVYDYTD